MPSRTELSLEQIQGVVLRGYGHLPQARFLLLTVRRDRARQARRFLAGLELTSAAVAANKDAQPDPFLNVAFTHGGLDALGADDTLLDAFPRAFVEGPTSETRARLLGDQGASHPRRWAWGAPRTAPVHVLLAIYAREGISALCAHFRRAAAEAGLDTAECLDTIRLPRRREHFGFRHGIGQPVVAGSRIAAPPGRTVAPGEVLLGHPNAFGEIAYAPGAPQTDFTRDGTYVVLRQLEQDVPGFWRFCRASTSSDAEAVRFASQMVGRWPSGAPLARYPPAEHATDPLAGHTVDDDDDDFGYFESDRDGRRCPFGAHVRRTNPRDWGTGETPDESRRIAARHRIVRRGRAYGAPLSPDADPLSYLQSLGAPDPSPGRGLHFVCFNANIERQFEFIQRQWCDNPKFAGLVNGVDPLVGNPRLMGREPPTFSIQRETASERVEIPGRFVRVRGGAYFLMPSLGAVRGLDPRGVVG